MKSKKSLSPKYSGERAVRDTLEIINLYGHGSRSLAFCTLPGRSISDIDVLNGTVFAGARRYYETRGKSSMREKLHKGALASIKEEMALPRVSASATKAIARQEKLPTADYPGSAVRAPGKIISAFAGVYARIASKLKVSPSFVSKVASGSRKSSQIEEALCDELRILKKDLATY
jgi:hypothetical protein